MVVHVTRGLYTAALLSMTERNLLVSSDGLDIEGLPSEDSLMPLILKYQQTAVDEEVHGCFGAAEVHWKKALGIAERCFPETQLFATLAIETGSFLARFLPKSEIPLKYLRAGCSRQHLLEPECGRRATFVLVKCLIDAECCKEAETVLSSLDRTMPEVDGRVRTCTGMIAFTRQDILKAEAVLRDAVEVCRNLSEETYAESMISLAEVLRKKEQYSECESILLETLPLLLKMQSLSLKQAMKTLLKAYDATNQFQKLEMIIQSVIRDLEEAQATSYFLSEILISLGDFCSKWSHLHAELHYLKALKLSQSKQQPSWYTARALFNLINFHPKFQFSRFRRGLNADVQELENQLKAIIGKLPTVSSMLSLFKPALIVIRKKQVLSKSAGFTEQLIKLITFGDEQERWEATTFLHSFTSNKFTSFDSKVSSMSKAAARDLAYGARRIIPKALQILQNCDVTQFEIIPLHCYDDTESAGVGFQRRVELSVAEAEFSYPTMESLVDFASYYERTRSITNAIEVLHKALKIAGKINPTSSKCVQLLWLLGRKTHNQSYYQQALIIANQQTPLSAKAVKSMQLPNVPECFCTSNLTISNEQMPEFNTFQDRLIHASSHMAYFEKVGTVDKIFPFSCVGKQLLVSYFAEKDTYESTLSRLQARLPAGFQNPRYKLGGFAVGAALVFQVTMNSSAHSKDRCETTEISGLREVLNMKVSADEARFSLMRIRLCYGLTDLGGG